MVIKRAGHINEESLLWLPYSNYVFTYHIVFINIFIQVFKLPVMLYRVTVPILSCLILTTTRKSSAYSWHDVVRMSGHPGGGTK